MNEAALECIYEFLDDRGKVTWAATLSGALHIHRRVRRHNAAIERAVLLWCDPAMARLFDLYKFHDKCAIMSAAVRRGCLELIRAAAHHHSRSYMVDDPLFTMFVNFYGRNYFIEDPDSTENCISSCESGFDTDDEIEPRTTLCHSCAEAGKTAIARGNLKLVKFVFSGSSLETANLATYAVTHGTFAIVKYLYDNRFICLRETLLAACRYDRVAVIRYVLERDIRFIDNIMNYIIFSGDVILYNAVMSCMLKLRVPNTDVLRRAILTSGNRGLLCYRVR